MSNYITIYDIERIRPNDLKIGHTSTKENPGLEIEVLDCTDYDALVQAIGYLKFVMPGPVFYRGQTRLYGTGSLKPSIYRDDNRARIKKLDELLIHLAGPSHQSIRDGFSLCALEQNAKVDKHLIFHDVPLYGLEGALQHYGVATRWIDITDSLPHALFFSLAQYTKLEDIKPFYINHSPQTGGSCCSRLMANQIVSINEDSGDDSFCYLLAISPGKPCVPSTQHALKGLTEYDAGFILDARTAIPSHYARPHAQHGLLCRPKVKNSIDQIVVFRLPIDKVRQWIGNGTAFSPNTIFPPIRHLSSPSPCANPTKAADKGLSDIEKNLIRIWKSAANKESYLEGIYEPLRELTNFVTVEELGTFEVFSHLENPSKRLDWAYYAQ